MQNLLRHGNVQPLKIIVYTYTFTLKKGLKLNIFRPQNAKSFLRQGSMQPQKIINRPTYKIRLNRVWKLAVLAHQIRQGGIGGGTIFKGGGEGQIFWSKKWHVSTGRRACATQESVWGIMCPLRSWSFFENVGLNEAIWCTFLIMLNILFGVFFFFFFTLEQDGETSGGAMPPSLRSGGATGTPTAGSAAYARGRANHTIINLPI